MFKLITLTTMCFIFLLFASCGANQMVEDPAYDENEYGVAGDYETAILEPVGDETYTEEQPPNVVAEINVAPLEFALAVANQRRREIEWPGHERLHELTAGRRPQPPEFDISRWWPRYSQYEQIERSSELISRDDAIADSKEFFDLLAYFYGSYVYFGGDDVFLPVLDAIFARLESEGDTMLLSVFAYVLSEELGKLVADNHFRIWFDRLGVSYDFFTMMFHVPFGRSERGIFNKETGKYVVHVVLQGHTLFPDEAFRLSLSQQGELYYNLVLVLPYGISHPAVATIVYESGEASVALGRFPPPQRPWGNAALNYFSGLPVVNISNFGFPDSTYGMNSQDARRFLEIADELRGEPVVVVDVRSNGGGNGTLPDNWVYRLTGNIPPLLSPTLHVGEFALTGGIYESWFFIAPESFRFRKTQTFGELHTVSGGIVEGLQANEVLIVLLVDRHSASASEGFANIMLGMENTLIVGQNTSGTLTTDLTWPNLNFPRTGVWAGFGHARNIHPQGLLEEGIGIAPDLWVSGNALTAVINLLSGQ